MHEIVLESAALLLTLFCLLYSVTARRELYALPKGGLRHALEERRFSFLLLLCSLLLSAVLALGSAWAQAYGAPGWAVLTLYTLLSLFRLLLPCLLALYISLIHRLLRWQESVNGQLREAAETATNAGKAKSQFLAQMSHEIRTPMNAIIGLDNIALLDPDLSPRTRDQPEKIGASARHLLGLINDILDMSRIESGRMALKAEFSFREFLDQIAVDLLAGSEPGHFDAILMDMRMPVMDGLTATREIRKLSHPDAGTIPIVALTANAFEEDVQQCLQAGMNGHVAKPVDTELLLKTLGRLIAAREAEYDHERKNE